MLRSVASDLGLHCLPVFHKTDAMLITVRSNENNLHALIIIQYYIAYLRFLA